MAKENSNERSHAAEASRDKMDKIISLCKRRGFIFQSSEIYGGAGSFWDYGPLGAQFKKNLKDLWWKKFVTERDDIVGLDSAIIQNPKVWEASGHLKSFSDPLVECKVCHKRFREDHVQALLEKLQITNYKLQINSKFQIPKEISDEEKIMVVCSDKKAHDFTESKNFNLMFKTFIGVSEDSASIAYLRPETAQGIFVNFQNVLQSYRIKPPFGIAQIGKAFRNEITPGNFIFRTREFEQGEIEYFVLPTKEESAKWYKYWIDAVNNFYLDLGIKSENLTIREHAKEELSHYSTGTSDIEYKFPFGVSELAGIAQRTDFDLKQHEKVSGKDMKYFDQEKNERFIPFVVEPSMGIDRAALAFLSDAYDESDGSDGRAVGEVTLRLNKILAPIKVGVFPLAKKEEIIKIAKGIGAELRKAGIETYYDESGSVGRRYRRQDEIGTPWCITVDFDSLEDKKVTIRDRDTMGQERAGIADIAQLVLDKLK